MRVAFTKMQGAGNDVAVLDATRAPLSLTREQIVRLADRRFGVGADQILVVEPSRTPGVDFAYRIWNGADGGEVEHCGNGARCFYAYVREKGLSDRARLVVETVNRRIVLERGVDGRVVVDMGVPDFEPAHLPFDAAGLVPRASGDALALWPLDLEGGERVEVGLVSMGNPHAVVVVPNVDRAPVERIGPLVERHPRFAKRVNVGFLQFVSRERVRLRVHERGAGETLACGTGACAAVAVGQRLGRLGTKVVVEARGGELAIDWPGGTEPLRMSGPAETVFEGTIDL